MKSELYIFLTKLKEVDLVSYLAHIIKDSISIT